MNHRNISWHHRGAGLSVLSFSSTSFHSRLIFIFPTLLFFSLNGCTLGNRFAPVHLWFLQRLLTHYFKDVEPFCQSFFFMMRFFRFTASADTQKYPRGSLFFEGCVPPLTEMISSPRPLTSLFPSLHSPSWVFRVAIALDLPQVPGTWTIIRLLCVIPIVLLTHSSLSPSFFFFLPLSTQNNFSLFLFLWNAVSSMQYVPDVLHALGLRFILQRIYETSTSSWRATHHQL